MNAGAIVRARTFLTVVLGAGDGVAVVAARATLAVVTRRVVRADALPRFGVAHLGVAVTVAGVALGERTPLS